MTDRRLRELERRWRESGTPDDEAHYLLAVDYESRGEFEPAREIGATALQPTPSGFHFSHPLPHRFRAGPLPHL